MVTDTAPLPSGRFPASWYPQQDNTVYKLNVVKNRPYTAMLVVTDQYESDGRLVTSRHSTLVARDSAGRSRVEIENGATADAHDAMIPTRSITITDPVSHCNFRWMEPQIDDERRSALVHCLPVTIRYVNIDSFAILLQVFAFQPKEEDASFRSEPLGQRSFGDVEAEGMRTIATHLDPQTGKTTKRITEVWLASEIQELVEMKSYDIAEGKPSPRDREPEDQLTKIKQIEPSADLFYPPPDFVIQVSDFR